MAHLDLVADIFERIAAAHSKLPARVLQAVESEVRSDWGGERHYIAKVGETGKAKLAERDERIRTEHRRGDHDELIARRHEITVRRVRQILACAV